MAELKFVEKEGASITVKLSVSSSEYELLKKSEDDLIILPANPVTLSEELTTGKLGNGNRIMLPNKILHKNSIEVLRKKLPSDIFEVEGCKYLLCKLDEKRAGVPVDRTWP